jgi:hypothetical protein
MLVPILPVVCSVCVFHRGGGPSASVHAISTQREMVSRSDFFWKGWWSFSFDVRCFCTQKHDSELYRSLGLWVPVELPCDYFCFSKELPVWDFMFLDI